MPTPKEGRSRVGNLIMSFLVLRGKNQEWLAEQVGVSPTVITHLIQGRMSGGRPYHGVRPARAGEKALLYRVQAVLDIPDDMLAPAVFASMGYFPHKRVMKQVLRELERGQREYRQSRAVG